MKIKVAKYIADFMAERNIQDVFTVTGGGAMHLNDALGHHDRLKCIYNHHEQACAIAAEGYMKLTGKLPLVCVTSGPGGTNALTGVLCAYLDSVPMFIISGQVKRETTIHASVLPLRQLGDQEFDITTCVTNMTKYSKIILDANEIAYYLEKAYYLCLTGRGGPVWLDIPLDIQAAIIETNNLNHFDPNLEAYKEKPVYNESLSNDIIEKIEKAKRPVILVGTGINLSDSREELIRLVEKLNIPIVTAWNAHDTIWDEHPCYCGRPGTIGTRGGNFVVQNSDLLLVLGCRLNIRQISYSYHLFAPHAFKIMVDIDKAELYKPTIKIDMPIWADVKSVIKSLLSRDLPLDYTEKHSEWLDWCRQTHLKYPVVLPEYYTSQNVLNPYVFIKEFTGRLKDDDKIICSNGSACVITFQAAIMLRKSRMFANSGCATMGYGLPAAIGAAVSCKGKRIICMEGDGSFQMNIQELQTVVYNQLNLKIFYINNNGYHSMRQTESNLFKDTSLFGVCEGNGLSFPEMSKVITAYGIPYMKVISVDDIEKAVQFIEVDGPAFIEVVVDERQFFEPKLSSKVLPDGKIISPEIDDMYPFLDRIEYESNKI